MRLTLPANMPTKREFILTFFQARFPEVISGSYTRLCSQVLERFMAPNYEGDDLRVGSDMHRLMVEMARNYQIVYNEACGIADVETPSYFIENVMGWSDFEYSKMETTFASENGSVSGWLNPKGSGSEGFMNKKHLAFALFFTYLMFTDTDQNRGRHAAQVAFVECLETLGITNIDQNVANRLFDFSWQDSGPEEVYAYKRVRYPYAPLTNTALTLFGTTVLVLISMVEKYNKYEKRRDEFNAVITALHNLYRRTFARELQATTTYEAMEYELFKSVVFFEPRAKVGVSSRYYPQDVFVMPAFYDFTTSATGKTPVDDLKAGKYGSNQLIVAKTGYGKSIYLQTLILCLLYQRYLAQFKAAGGTDPEMPSEQENTLQKLAQEMKTPSGMHVISIPAKMYTACYKRRAEYAGLSEDFVGMYLTYMWSQLPARVQNELDLKLSGADRKKNLGILKNYLRSLAGSGRLVLVLDSFDEVPAGAMRTSYIKALHNFCGDYCKVTGDSGTGSAHIILSSRQMSDATMQRLKAPFQNPMDGSYQCKVFGISPLSDKQRDEFVTRWLRVFRNQDNQNTNPKDLLSLIAQNHYYCAYADNPYMLSVVCQSHAKGVADIASEFIGTLIQRMKHNGLMETESNADMGVLFNSVLEHIEKYIGEIARETVMKNNPYITQEDLRCKFTSAVESMILPGQEVSRDTIDQVVENLHELFVMQAGIIVPADERDQDYQFINDQIRYELAAKHLSGEIDRLLPDFDKVTRLLSSITSDEAYVEMMVRLLCVSPRDQSKPINWAANEILLYHLVTHNFETDEQGIALDNALLDLVYGLYGMNIMNRKVPGKQHEARLRGLQRLVLRRLITSPYFTHVVTDTAAFLATDACVKNSGRLTLPKV